MHQTNAIPSIDNLAMKLRDRLNAQFFPPRLDQNLIRHVLAEEFGLTGEIHQLSGEREQNFLLQQDGEDRYVVKVFRHSDAPGTIELQTCALQHLKNQLPQMSVPAIRKTLSGEAIHRHKAAGEEVFEIRVLEYLEGQPIGDGVPPSTKLAINAGILVGTVTRQLGHFQHDKVPEFMPWDVSNRLLGDPAFWSLGGADIRRHEDRLRQGYAEILPVLLHQRAHLIYNDAHLENILRRSGDADDASGLIDFGDILHAPIACDVATLALGFAENADAPAALAAAAVAGYHSAYPLLSQEFDMIYDLMIARQALSVLLFDIKLTDPRLHSQQLKRARSRLMDRLGALLGMDSTQFNSAIRDACGMGE